MANLKFYKGTETQINAQQVTPGAIWFNTTDKTINVRTSAGAWEKYAGNLKDAAWGDNNKLTITKYDGSSIELDFSDMASATGVAAVIGTFADAAKNDNTASIHARINAAFKAIGTKLEAEDQVVKSVDTTADAGVALVLDENDKLSVEVTEGAIAKNNTSVVLGGQVYTAIEEVKTQITGKNVSAEGDDYVSASAADNKVTVAATQDLIDAVDLANSAVQKVTVLGQELENDGELTVAQAKTALGLGSAAYVDTTAFDAAGAAAAAKKEILGYTEGEEIPTTDAQTIKGINDRIDSVAGAAKSYSIAAVTEGLGTNVKEAFKLVDEKGNQAGAQINIYKDSSLISVDLVDENEEGTKGQFLKYVYVTESGEETTVYVNVSELLVEAEFKNGLEVSSTGEVSVKVDAQSETFLTVGANGVKLAGVQNAINAAAATAEQNAKNYADGLKEEIDGVIEENEKTTVAALTELDTRVNALEDKNATINSALQQADITTGSANGTIAVKGADVAVAGLGSAAYTESNAYATAAQGQLADSAVQSITVLGEVLKDGSELTVDEAKAALGLKDAAYVTVESLNATAQGYATTAKNEVIGDADNDTKDSKTIEGVKKYVDAQVADGLSWAIFE